ncbi:hypothetical protein HFN78_24705 [Rhizobium laguerreae]|uniref:hypothetical protein n=1 Tax=Rhizobium laguerreae TaxID=1076926 RepID=UPI001C90C1B6|nr:hypothetical protein [Rhizobium laguerreae]MBY3474085.1 hypothetical protein [Rhizobium laguerreae]MBY3521879.1 hypothetical protein [Rhizobium laguerreae]
MQQQISLYIELKEGEKVDLETAARAALAFDAVLKEIAFSIDPFSAIRVELESGTEGSLSLNSIIKSVSGRFTQTQLTSIVGGVMFWFAQETASWTYSAILDEVNTQPEIHQSLTKEEVEAVAKEIAKILDSKVAEKQVGKVYQELQRDDAVKGVGVAVERDKKPRYIVPRSEFQQRGRIITGSESTGSRTETTVQTLTLVSPVLIKGKRKWKFRQQKFEFGAPILDEAFLDRLLSGREPIPMSDGIAMKVKLTVKEEKKDGVWQIVDRSIDEVIEVIQPPKQYDILGSPSE